MSLKKKSKSLGHLTALGVQPPPPIPPSAAAGGHQQPHPQPPQHHGLLAPPPSLLPPGSSLGMGSPNFGSPRLKKHISVKNFNERLRFLNSHHGYSNGNGGGGGQDSVDSADLALHHQQQQQQQQAHLQQQQSLRPPPMVRSTTALNLGTPMAAARADKQMQAQAAAAAAAASAASAGKHTPKVRQWKPNLSVVFGNSQSHLCASPSYIDLVSLKAMFEGRGLETREGQIPKNPRRKTRLPSSLSPPSGDSLSSHLPCRN